MDERVIQFRVGVVVLAAAFVTGILIFIFGEGWKSRYTVYMNYRTAQGVSVNTPVRKNGILIGRVTNVELTEQGVRLTAKVDKAITLYTTEICQLSNTSLIGDPILEFVPGDEAPAADANAPVERIALKHGDTIKNTRIKADPLAEMTDAVGSVKNLVDTVTIAVESVSELKDDVQQSLTIFNEETLPTFNSTVASVGDASDNINNITQSIRLAMQGEDGDLRTFFDEIRLLTSNTNDAVLEFQIVMQNVNDVIGEDVFRQELKQSLTRLPAIITNAESTLAEAEATMESLGRAAESANTNLENLTGLTGPLGENGAEMVSSLQESLISVNAMAAQLEEFTRTLNESDGTVGLLLNDPQLYYSFLTAVENVEDLTSSFRPIVNDLRVAADKIARDPGQLGVRGALDRSPVGTGSKGILWRPSQQWLR